MARGMANNEPVVSMASTKEYENALDRIYGPDRQPQRGRWIYDPALGKCVRAEEYHAPEMALHAPIMMDRFYENTKATDGTDIGSRRKHRAYMKEHNLTTADDFGGEWKRAQARRDALKEGKWSDPKRREALERAFYKIDGKP